MRTLSLNYAAVGAFVLAMVTAAIAAGAMLAGGSGPSDSYHVMLDNVSDIRFGTVVRYEGYPVGEVGRIVPQADGAGMRFRVDISVERGWRIPSDSVARIGSSNLLANKTIDITGGQSDEAVVVGTAIRGAQPSDVFAAMSSLAGELGDLNKESLRPLIDQVGGVVAEIDSLVRRDLGQITGGMAAVASDAEGRVPVILASLESMTSELGTTVEALRGLMTPDAVDSLGRTMRNAEAASASFAGIGGRLAGTASQLDGLITRLDQVVLENEGEVAESLENAAYILRSVSQSIDAISHDLEGSTRNMNEFSRQIRQDPGALFDMPWRNGAPHPAVAP